MSIVKTGTSYQDETNTELSVTSRIRLFNVLKDWDSTKFVNIFRTFVIPDTIKSDSNYFHIHEAEEEEWWENVSNLYYETPNFWYIICMMNDIVNPYEEIEPGQQIKVLKKIYLYTLLRDMEVISRL